MSINIINSELYIVSTNLVNFNSTSYVITDKNSNTSTIYYSSTPYRNYYKLNSKFVPLSSTSITNFIDIIDISGSTPQITFGGALPTIIPTTYFSNTFVTDLIRDENTVMSIFESTVTTTNYQTILIWDKYNGSIYHEYNNTYLVNYNGVNPQFNTGYLTSNTITTYLSY